jgi:hypothetical protein
MDTTPFINQKMGCLLTKPETALHMQAKASRGNEMRRGESGSAAAAAMLGGNDLSSKVEIFVSCRNLKDLDTGSLSDPFCILEEYVEPRINRTYGGGTMQQGNQAKWVEIGRSEIVVNSLNPDFVTRFKMQYRFEESQKIRVRIYDADDGKVPPSKLILAKQDFNGQTPTTYLADVLNSSRPAKGTKVFQLEGDTKKGPATGTCTIKIEEMKNQNGYVTLKIRGKKLTNKDGFMGKSDPFLRLSRVVQQTGRNRPRGAGNATKHGGASVEKMPVFKTEVIMNNLNPKWNECVVSIQGLCNGDLNRPILFEVFDYDSDGSHDFIGSVTASVNDLQSGIRELGLISKSGRSGGTLIMESVQIENRASFLEYVTGGTEINFLVAIDFTASNNSPRDGGPSLHTLYADGRMNEYQQCIHRIGDVLEYYDHDKQFPTWGFGGVVPQGVSAEHCFNLVPGGPNATAPGIQGIMNAYHNAVNNVTLRGPTIFSQVLQTATSLSAAGADGSSYYTLLIITDGVITDMENTKNAIVAACNFPLSILIVGVGPADFSRMEELDGDDEVLRDSNGQKATRDIVQFVSMRDFQNQMPQAFSSELLAEIPAQLCGYMRSKNIRPRTRPVASIPIAAVVPIVVNETKTPGQNPVFVNK